MKLTYHEGNNFGDKLNNFIFQKYLPYFFDDEEEELFLGIGTILGLKKSSSRKIVFSSGVSDIMKSTYGSIPIIDNSYDIICVRGPLTAKVLNLDNSLAVIDGAYLLYDFYKKSERKKYRISYMPHVGSESFFNELKDVFEELGVNYISPKEDLKIVLEKINQSELVLAEAMHGAIVADALRVPWIPIKMYSTINEFKWKDWLFSIDKHYYPIILPSLFNWKVFDSIISNKIHTPKFVNKLVFVFYQFFNKIILKRRLKRLILLEGEISDDNLVKEKVETLKSKLNEIRNTYSKC